ncbi:MAG: phage terminase large subunit family protein [Hyphomicrobiaceae bacterium]|nr:phage terminase large subunit family protein [Hyphomicrobiaceae bacterium]
MKPVKQTTADEWARNNRFYKPSSGFPGPRDPSLTRYMIAFGRSFDVADQIETYGATYSRSIMVTSSQSGKTEVILDVIGRNMDQRPAPIMYLGPTRVFVENEIEPRLMEMINDAPRLKERLNKKGNKKTRKLIGGVPVALAWAGSPAQVAGMAAQLALIDELDRMAASIKGEGDPLALIEARGTSYRDAMNGAISTPLLGTVDIEVDPVSGLELWMKMEPEDIESPIWRQFQSGTMHHWSWPCPECNEYFVPRFKQLHILDEWNPAQAKGKAHMSCPRCGGVIEEHHKKEMNERGVYVAPGQNVDENGTVTGTPPETTTLSFWVSGLCTPFRSFGDRAAQYVAAKQSGEQEKLKGVINTGFGELFAPGGGDVPEWQEVADLKRGYKMLELPKGVRILTMTVDVQKRRLIYVIRGWGHRATSWLIDAGELHGSTTHEEVWGDLASLLQRPIRGMVIKRAFIDSGYRPGKPYMVPVNKVYEFCRRFPRLAYPTKGRATMDKPLFVSKHDVNSKGKIKRYGLDLVMLNTDHGKSWVHERIRWPDDQPGSGLLPADISNDYCKQIVAEARIRRPNGAPQWIARSKENHFLDCEAMQAGMAHMLNMHLIGPLDEDRDTKPKRRPKHSGRSKNPKNQNPDTKRKQGHKTQKPGPMGKPGDANARLSAKEQRRQRLDALAARMYK